MAAVFVIGALGATAGVAAGKWLFARRPASPAATTSSSLPTASNLEERSTTSSAGGGAAAYETNKAVDEYLQFHFGAAADILPYSKAPHDALEFPARCAQMCEKYCDALKDFNGEVGDTIALDVGCAVGGASFELARSFSHVLGIDFSSAFVDAAKEMKELGTRQYSAVVEGDIMRKYQAAVPEDIPRQRTKFMQGDACNLPVNLNQFDAVLAANLVCRLPDPMLFFARLPSLVKPGGVAVIVSPHSWLAAWTPKEKWIGGYTKDGKPVYTAEVMKQILSNDFDLVAQEDMPFLIREHVRKYQWGCSNAMVWKRKGKAKAT